MVAPLKPEMPLAQRMKFLYTVPENDPTYIVVVVAKVLPFTHPSFPVAATVTSIVGSMVSGKAKPVTSAVISTAPPDKIQLTSLGSNNRPLASAVILGLLTLATTVLSVVLVKVQLDKDNPVKVTGQRIRLAAMSFLRITSTLHWVRVAVRLMAKFVASQVIVSSLTLLAGKGIFIQVEPFQYCGLPSSIYSSGTSLLGYILLLLFPSECKI